MITTVGFPVTEKFMPTIGPKVFEILGQIKPDDLESILVMWDRWWTPYHNLDHLREMFTSLENYFISDLGDLEVEATVYAILVHDAVYSITSKTNEEQCAIMLDDLELHADVLALAKGLVLGTKNHEEMLKSKTHVVTYRVMAFLDLERLISGDPGVHARTERQIFREYGIYKFHEYRKGRIDVLTKLTPLIDYLSEATLFTDGKSNLRSTIDWLRGWTPKVGLMVGSFNPFHVGHLDLMLKSDAIFDKTIVGVGYNASKDVAKAIAETTAKNLSEAMRYREVFSYDGMTVDLMKRIEQTEGVEVTLVRGIRDEKDLQMEKTLHAYNSQMMPGMRSVFFMPTPGLGHVSSSDIRTIIASGGEPTAFVPSGDDFNPDGQFAKRLHV